MDEHSVVIVGLPESGKTTFLAALWHLVTSQEVETKLRFGDLRAGDSAYLNAIAARWREAKVQDRTSLAGAHLVSMRLRGEAGDLLTVTFPDLPGEDYLRMWEERECDRELLENLQLGTNVILFIHADAIKTVRWIVDDNAIAEAAGIEQEEGDETPVPWEPKTSPTQVQLVDILQLIQSDPIGRRHRRLIVMLSVWDKAQEELLSPAQYLGQKLPLLDQYLRNNRSLWEWRIYGLSAQGGDYDPLDTKGQGSQSARDLKALDSASERIQLSDGEQLSHDLTEPLAWLMG